MPESLQSRVKRSAGPKKKLHNDNYRRLALPHLINDFQSRCAYCMDFLGDSAESSIHVDHFNPKSRSNLHKYSNLFLADSGCNMHKSDKWPTSSERKKQLRFLNCCKELDYDTQIFEDEHTHELIGITPAAKYHIIKIGLNASHLIRKRKKRAEIHKMFKDSAVEIKHGVNLETMRLLIEKFRQVLDTCIPPINPPPK